MPACQALVQLTIVVKSQGGLRDGPIKGGSFGNGLCTTYAARRRLTVVEKPSVAVKLELAVSVLRSFVKVFVTHVGKKLLKLTPSNIEQDIIAKI